MMNGKMPKINPNLIPRCEMNILCRTLLDAAKRFYSDPVNVERFNEWKQSEEGERILQRLSDKQGEDNG